MYPINTLGSITYLLKLGGVLHSLTQNLERMQYLHWVTLYTPWAKLFWSKLLEGYCSCLEDFMNMHYPSIGILEIHWAP
jgi:hypothetical protein